MDVVRIPSDIPTVIKFAGEAEIIIEIIEAVRKAAFEDHDGVQLPAFQKLGKTLAAGNCVGGGKRETVAEIEVAVAAFGANVETVLCAEMAIAAGFVDRMRVGVARYDVQTLPAMSFVGYLQAVVARAFRVSEFSGFTQKRILVDKRPVGLFTSELVASSLEASGCRWSIRLVDVKKAEQFHTALPDITHLQRRPISNRSLHVEIPEFRVRRVEVILDGGNAAWL